MEVRYREHAFDFEPDADSSFIGRLVLDDCKRELLKSLLATKADDWCLDDDGERLPADRLFDLSPLSYLSPEGSIKLLCRFFNIDNGVIFFNTPESYDGEQFRWLR